MTIALEPDTLFQRLSQVRTLSFQAWSKDNAWRRVGSGRVSTKRLATGLIVKEAGVWRQTDIPHKHYQFSNSWLYEWDEEGVVLSHLRFGEHHPVALCRLVEHPAGRWVAVDPHYCGQDSYVVSLTVCSCEQLICNWQISGGKAEQKHIVYHL